MLKLCLLTNENCFEKKRFFGWIIYKINSMIQIDNAF